MYVLIRSGINVACIAPAICVSTTLEKEIHMITRKDAENQAVRCLEYHAATYAAIVGAVALLKPRALIAY